MVSPPQTPYGSGPSTTSLTETPPFSDPPPSTTQPGPPRRSSIAKQEWHALLRSKHCPEPLNTCPDYAGKISEEFDRRERAEAQIEQFAQAADQTRASEMEQQRRLRWAQDMIVTNPSLSAELYWAMQRIHRHSRSGDAG